MEILLRKFQSAAINVSSTLGWLVWSNIFDSKSSAKKKLKIQKNASMKRESTSTCHLWRPQGEEKKSNHPSQSTYIFLAPKSNILNGGSLYKIFVLRLNFNNKLRMGKQTENWIINKEGGHECMRRKKNFNNKCVVKLLFEGSISGGISNWPSLGLLPRREWR